MMKFPLVNALTSSSSSSSSSVVARIRARRVVVDDVVVVVVSSSSRTCHPRAPSSCPSRPSSSLSSSSSSSSLRSSSQMSSSRSSFVGMIWEGGISVIKGRLGRGVGVGVGGGIASSLSSSIVSSRRVAIAITTLAVTGSTSNAIPSGRSSCDGGGASSSSKRDDDDNDDDDDDEDSFDSFVSRVRSMISSIAAAHDVPSSLPSNVVDVVGNYPNDGSSVERLTSAALSHLSSFPMTNVSYGFVVGYVSGYALRKIGRISAAVLGTSFLAMQALAYAGYVDVRHDRLREVVERYLDRNGDGIVDASDLMECIDAIRRVAGYGIDDDVVGGGRGNGRGGGGGNGKDGKNDDDGSEHDATNGVYACAGGFGLGFYGGLRYG
ncbi:hypothetical protein ACHAXA_003348 [Cyclostephanos tholiformis]|uniref:EF-hand domain-containing protein n=1 Tax=Cyclostephanos tholiformis TaxID=382380 RepID=A0ABD3RCM1_9STRA